MAVYDVGIGKLNKWFAQTLRPLAFDRLLDALERRELRKLSGECETILDHLQRLFSVIPSVRFVVEARTVGCTVGSIADVVGRPEEIEAALDWAVFPDPDSSAHGDSGCAYHRPVIREESY